MSTEQRKHSPGYPPADYHANPKKSAPAKQPHVCASACARRPIQIQAVKSSRPLPTDGQIPNPEGPQPDLVSVVNRCYVIKVPHSRILKINRSYMEDYIPDETGPTSVEYIGRRLTMTYVSVT